MLTRYIGKPVGCELTLQLMLNAPNGGPRTSKCSGIGVPTTLERLSARAGTMPSPPQAEKRDAPNRIKSRNAPAKLLREKPGRYISARPFPPQLFFVDAKNTCVRGGPSADAIKKREGAGAGKTRSSGDGSRRDI